MTGYLTTKQAADYCAMAYRTFRQWAKADGLRPDGFAGKRARYAPVTLDRWLKLRRER